MLSLDTAYSSLSVSRICAHVPTIAQKKNIFFLCVPGLNFASIFAFVFSIFSKNIKPSVPSWICMNKQKSFHTAFLHFYRRSLWSRMLHIYVLTANTHNICNGAPRGVDLSTQVLYCFCKYCTVPGLCAILPPPPPPTSGTVGGRVLLIIK